MATQTSMLHVRVDERRKADAAEKLAGFGLRATLTSDPEAHDAWFRAKVRKALAETGPTVSHQQVMDEAQALITRKRHARAWVDRAGSCGSAGD